jgi:hypothetical protein
MNHIPGLVSGIGRFGSPGSKPVLHHLAPAGIPCCGVGSCEGSVGHQEAFPAGTFLRICARETTSVSQLSGENPDACSTPAPALVAMEEGPEGRGRLKDRPICFSQFP